MSGSAMTAVLTLSTSTNCDTHRTPRPAAPRVRDAGVDGDGRHLGLLPASQEPIRARRTEGASTMPPARKPAKSRSKARAHRSPVPWPPRLPVLEQRHLDLIGLGLVAVGVFLAFPLYLRWEGGEAGQAIVDGLTWGIGRVAWATPVALVAAGVLLVLRPALPAGVRPSARARLPAERPPAWVWRWARSVWGRRTGARGRARRAPRPGMANGSRACSPRSARTSWPSSCSAPRCCC